MVIDEIWQMMMSFAGYSFCKPHSASYARVSFQAAYLKAHFPAEFMAAVISNSGGFYSTFAYVSEARRLGLDILTPDVNHSQIRWRGQDRQVRVGLMALKDLGKKTRKRIVEDQPFSSFEDLLKRARPDERETRALLHAGACDELADGGSREQMLWHLARRSQADPQAADLFEAPAPRPPEIPAASRIQRLRRQYRVLEFLTSQHPMLLFEPSLKGVRRVMAKDLEQYAGQRVRIAGWLITGKTVTTNNHQPMQFLTFEDETGLVEATFFPQTYRKFYMMLDWFHPYTLTGLVEENFGVCTLTVDRAERIVPRSRAA